MRKYIDGMAEADQANLDDRAAWIKWLRQHDGLAKEKHGVPYELFGVLSHEGLVVLLSLAVRLRPKPSATRYWKRASFARVVRG